MEDGTVDFDDSYGEGDADADNFDSYECDNCGEYFTKGDIGESWQEALHHLVAKVQA